VLFPRELRLSNEGECGVTTDGTRLHSRDRFISIVIASSGDHEGKDGFSFVTISQPSPTFTRCTPNTSRTHPPNP